MIYIVQHPLENRFLIYTSDTDGDSKLLSSFEFDNNLVRFSFKNVLSSLRELFQRQRTILILTYPEEFHQFMQGKEEYNSDTIWKFVESSYCTCGGCGEPLINHHRLQRCPSA